MTGSRDSILCNLFIKSNQIFNNNNLNNNININKFNNDDDKSNYNEEFKYNNEIMKEILQNSGIACPSPSLYLNMFSNFDDVRTSPPTSSSRVVYDQEGVHVNTDTESKGANPLLNIGVADSNFRGFEMKSFGGVRDSSSKDFMVKKPQTSKIPFESIPNKSQSKPSSLSALSSSSSSSTTSLSSQSKPILAISQSSSSPVHQNCLLNKNFPQQLLQSNNCSTIKINDDDDDDNNRDNSENMQGLYIYPRNNSSTVVINNYNNHIISCTPTTANTSEIEIQKDLKSSKNHNY
jgi:hypothetical protein